MDASRRGDLHRTAASTSKDKWSTIEARSRVVIATQSWPDRDAIAALSPRNPNPIDAQIMATITGS